LAEAEGVQEEGLLPEGAKVVKAADLEGLGKLMVKDANLRDGIRILSFRVPIHVTSKLMIFLAI
jgi:hypothetical protein